MCFYLGICKRKLTLRNFCLTYTIFTANLIVYTIFSSRRITHTNNTHVQQYCNVHDFNQVRPGLDDIECKISISYQPRIHICIYAENADVWISAIYHQGNKWEREIHENIMKVIDSDSTMNLIDIGANIGSHSLAIAKLGRQVVAVEPVASNILRLHKSVLLNKIQDKYTIVENAISDTRDIVSLKDGQTNKGGYNIVSKSNHTTNTSEDIINGIQTIYMDDLLEVINFHRAVIKIDIESYEHKAFTHASKLLDKLYIPAIFMEFYQIRKHHEQKDTDDWHQAVSMLTLLEGKGYEPYDSVENVHLYYNSWGSWPRDVMFVLKELISNNILL